MNSELLIVLALIGQGIILGSFCAFVGGEKGRDRTAWFILGFVFSIVALVAVAGVPVKQGSVPEPLRVPDWRTLEKNDAAHQNVHTT